MAYRYYLTQRPPSLGTQPRGTINIVAYDERINGKWGYVEYKEPLTDHQINSYELERG